MSIHLCSWFSVSFCVPLHLLHGLSIFALACPLFLVLVIYCMSAGLVCLTLFHRIYIYICLYYFLFNLALKFAWKTKWDNELGASLKDYNYESHNCCKYYIHAWVSIFLVHSNLFLFNFHNNNGNISSYSSLADFYICIITACGNHHNDRSYSITSAK